MHAIAAKNLGNSLAALVAGFGTAGVDTNRIMLCDPCAGHFHSPPLTFCVKSFEECVMVHNPIPLRSQTMAS